MTEEDKQRRALRRTANKEAATRSRKRRILQMETLTQVGLRCNVSLGARVLRGQRRKSVYNFGGTDLEKFGGSASPVGAKLRWPKAKSPSRLGGLGERRKLPQRGLGRNPRNRRNFEYFKRKWSKFLDPVNLTFLNSLKCTKSLRFINEECFPCFLNVADMQISIFG